jgi:hypothetical protein
MFLCRNGHYEPHDADAGRLTSSRLDKISMSTGRSQCQCLIALEIAVMNLRPLCAERK